MRVPVLVLIEAPEGERPGDIRDEVFTVLEQHLDVSGAWQVKSAEMAGDDAEVISMLASYRPVNVYAPRHAKEEVSR